MKFLKGLKEQPKPKTTRTTFIFYVALCVDIKTVELSSADLNAPDEGYERYRLMDALFCPTRPAAGSDYVINGTGSIPDPLINKED